MKLNLGCGQDIRDGYVNVDSFGVECDVAHDITDIPWPFESKSCDEILMLDVLEHIPYAKTDAVLMEAWRVLKRDGKIVVQAPDFVHCSRAIVGKVGGEFLCNFCGTPSTEMRSGACKCGKSLYDIQIAAVHRLYGGQDRDGNWHHNAFTPELLAHRMMKLGFYEPVLTERNENGETFWQNWNFRLEARKAENLW